jgi:RecB family exonuclease
MPTPRLVQIKAWSYSRFGTYSQCPRKAKYSIIDKMREPDHPAMINGSRVHAIAGVVIARELPKPDRDNAAFMPELKAVLASRKIPSVLETFTEEFKYLQKVKAMVEQEWAFNEDWEVTDWFSSRAWLRIKVDCCWLETTKDKNKTNRTVVHIRDHKTGKFSEDHALQRSLYALGGLLMFPDAAEVVAAHWYLDAGREEKESWQANQLEALKTYWLKKTKAMLSDTTFAPTPSDKCRYCHFRKSNGGPCEF